MASKINVVSGLEKRVEILENDMHNTVRRNWFFWILGAVGMVLIMSYNKMELMSRDISDVKSSVSYIEGILKNAESHDE